MISHPKRAAAIAAIAGVFAGGALAAALPNAQGTPSNAPWRAPSEPLHLDLTARAASAEGAVTFEPQGPVRIALRRADPAGGPDWAIRTFSARTRLPRGMWRAGRPRYAGGPVQTCAQLVRITHGHAGWIDGHNTFRVVEPTSQIDAPSVCVNRRQPAKFAFLRAQVRTFSPLDLASASDPVALGNVMWGLAGDGVERLTVTIAGHRSRPHVGAHGAFLRFAGPSRDLGSASAAVRWRDSHRFVVTDPSAGSFSGRFGTRRAPRDPAAPGTDRIVARTYDPGGAASWGLRSLRLRSGRWCTGAVGQIVGRQVGMLDTQLGTFTARSLTTPRGGCALENTNGLRLTADHPVTWDPRGWGGSSPFGSGAGPQTDALRRQGGRITFAGRAIAGVTSVTIRTATTVRTVEPTGPTHAFVVSYDTSNGGLMLAFNTAHLTAHFADGHSRTVSAMGPGI